MSYIRHIFTLFLKPKSSEGRDTARAMFPAIRIKPENWKIQMIYKFIDRISNKVSVLEYVIEVWNSFCSFRTISNFEVPDIKCKPNVYGRYENTRQ